MDWLGQRGVTRFLQFDHSNFTGSVEVLPGPSYDIAAPAAWDFIQPSEENCGAAEKASVVVFGTLAQRYPVSRGTIRLLVERARASGAVAIADLNLRAPFIDEEVIVWTLRHCDLLKLNREELALVSGMLGAAGDTATLFDGLVREFGLSRAVLTCGAEGAWFFDAGRKWHQPAVAAPVVDTVGAGDAFTAVLAAALAEDVPLAQAAPAAAEVASYVVSQPGAMPVWPEGLRERVRSVLDTTA
jgi:fructokinase